MVEVRLVELFYDYLNREKKERVYIRYTTLFDSSFDLQFDQFDQEVESRELIK
jgi:hypothetical protein